MVLDGSEETRSVLWTTFDPPSWPPSALTSICLRIQLSAVVTRV